VTPGCDGCAGRIGYGQERCEKNSEMLPGLHTHLIGGCRVESGSKRVFAAMWSENQTNTYNSATAAPADWNFSKSSEIQDTRARTQRRNKLMKNGVSENE